MSQHPKATVDWALQGLEAAIRDLGDGALASRVRSQFHQLLLAIEHEAFAVGLTCGGTIHLFVEPLDW